MTELNVLSRFPGANATCIDMDERSDPIEIRFSPDPSGGREALWFHLRIVAKAGEPAGDRKIRLTWLFADHVPGGDRAPHCVPVYTTPGRPWSRLKQGEETRAPNGTRHLSWLIPYPDPEMDVAFCFPYPPSELQRLVERSKDFWSVSSIGVTAGGRDLLRLANEEGKAGGKQPGIYLVARQYPGESPGSWVLDGFLRQWSQNRRGGYIVAAVPFADPDGVRHGVYGRNGTADDMDADWPPQSGRREHALIARDLTRWTERCNPILLLDVQATPGAWEHEGVYAATATSENRASAGEETKWCNVLEHELKNEWARNPFSEHDPSVSSLIAWAGRELGIPSLRLHIPYTSVHGNILTTKNYRDIGQKIAQAVLRRKG